MNYKCTIRVCRNLQSLIKLNMNPEKHQEWYIFCCFKTNFFSNHFHLVQANPPTWAISQLFFTIVIYDHNDSGQYYKTTITIVIDDPS